ncbi:hypothetical protein ACFWOJ_30525 [Streptomyces sp. NPDC058439]|uniref:hypothetical protein n=1 Tax=Streptomyces sp. NPDC058439 TaxID=3346500 RepID=UPI00364EC3F0
MPALSRKMYLSGDGKFMAGDSAYLGNRGIKPVAVVSAPEDTGVLELPVVGEPGK